MAVVNDNRQRAFRDISAHFGILPRSLEKTAIYGICLDLWGGGQKWLTLFRDRPDRPLRHLSKALP
jgi:hypothetical protein